MAEFGRATRRILGDEALRLIRELNEVIQQAGMGDDLMDRTDAVAVAERKELSVRARRLAGDLLGEAAKLGVK
jgi:hypothetical protein